MLEEPVFINLNQTLKIKGKKTDEEYFEVQLVQDDFIACVSQKRRNNEGGGGLAVKSICDQVKC